VLITLKSNSHGAYFARNATEGKILELLVN
jgi:hypothetical protein